MGLRGQSITGHPSPWVAGLAAALLLGASAGAPALAPAAPVAMSRGPELARLSRTAEARARPSIRSGRVATVSPTRPITGEQTVLPVIGHSTDPHGTAWLDVLLPGRPNSHSGWIVARAATVSKSSWSMVIHLATRVVRVDHAGRLIRTFSAVVGKPTTPTPMGRFFVEESVALGGGEVGAPFALALSARSNVLQEFAGGPGQIALHGTNNIGGVLGTGASHGCIRLATAAITWLAARIRPGTPVAISA